MKYYRAVGTMVGSIVGVGVFGLPYAFSQSGWVVGAITLFIMTGLLIALQLMYAEVVLQTEGRHRLVGYVRKYLGQPWGWISLVALASGLWGAMIAYIIIGGRFVHVLFSPLFGGPEVVYSLILAALASALMYRGIQFASKIEVTIISLLLFLFVFIILASVPHIDLSNLMQVNLKNVFVPYGVVLFSIAGMGVVPEMREVLGRRHEKYLASTIVVAMVLILLLYTAFSFAVVGVTGSATTEAAFDGLVPVLGNTFRIVGAVLGSLTIVSIFMLLGIQLQNTLRFDFGMKRLQAFVLTAGVPVVLFLLGIREFIELIGFVGGIFVGLLGILVVLTYEKMRKSPVCRFQHCLHVPGFLSWALAGLFVLGMILSIITSLT